MFPDVNIQLDREYFLLRRQTILLELEYIEKRLQIFPRVSELRKQAKEESKVVQLQNENKNSDH